MILKIGNFFFRYRNGLFPLAYLLLFVPWKAFLPDQTIALVLGTLIALTGQTIRAVTIGLEYIIRGGRNRRVYAETLVQGGVFAHCRNPLYVGNYLILSGVGLASNSLLFLCIGMPFFTLAYFAIITAEETYLANKFGVEFHDYCRRVPRIIPNLKCIQRTLISMRFNWQRLITAEYGSAFLWMAAIVLVTLWDLWLSGQYRSSGSMVLGLWGTMVFLVFAYGAARFLKKKRLLVSQEPPLQENAAPPAVNECPG